MSTLDLRALLQALHDHEVRFVVIGGVAVGAHGYVRSTADLDIVPDPSSENADRLARTLAGLEASLPMDGGRPFVAAGDVSSLTRRRNMTLDTRAGALDVVQRAAGVPSFEQLDSDAVDSDLLGVPVRVCSLEHLRQMKQARASAQDRADLENLPPE
ncbi:MAG: hypothetical protein WD844_01270 [Thermoleophilaceae bacterium]